jgi:hypothetical protein
MARKVSNDDTPAPLAVTVSEACKLSGFRPTSVWKFLREGRLQAIRVAGCRRTLVSYRSLVELLAPHVAPDQPRRRDLSPRRHASNP